MTVTRVRVGDVLRLQRRVVTVDPEESYRLIGIYSFGKGIFHREPVTGIDLGNYRFFRIEPGDLVLSNIQAWEGAIAYASDLDAETVGTHRFLTYTPIDDRIDSQWAKWFFLSEPGMALIRQAAPGTTMRNRTLAIERFENLVVPLPAPEDQRLAARRIERARSTGELSLAALERPSHAVALLPSLTDGILHRHSVSTVVLAKVAEFVSDTVHPGDDPAPADRFVGLQHVESHTGRRVGSDPLGPMKGRKFRFRPGDVVYGYLRPYLNKVWVADCHGLCSVDQYVLRPRAGMSPEILAFALRGRATLSSAIEMTHSLQLPRLRSGLLASVRVPVVAPAATAEAIARLEHARDQVVRITQARARQVATADALLPAALNQEFATLS